MDYPEKILNCIKMARLYRHSLFIANTCRGDKLGEKFEKHKCSRKLRRLIRATINRNTEILPLAKEVSDRWSWSKDGRKRISACDTNLLRK